MLPGRRPHPKMQDEILLQGPRPPAALPSGSTLDHPPWDRRPVLPSRTVGFGHAPSRTAKAPGPAATSPLVPDAVDPADSLVHNLGGKCSLSAAALVATSSFCSCSCCPQCPLPAHQHPRAPPLPPCSRLSGCTKCPGASPRPGLCLLSCGACFAAATPGRPEPGTLCDRATWRNWGSPETSCATSRTAVSGGFVVGQGP